MSYVFSTGIRMWLGMHYLFVTFRLEIIRIKKWTVHIIITGTEYEEKEQTSYVQQELVLSPPSATQDSVNEPT